MEEEEPLEDPLEESEDGTETDIAVGLLRRKCERISCPHLFFFLNNNNKFVSIVLLFYCSLEEENIWNANVLNTFSPSLLIIHRKKETKKNLIIIVKKNSEENLNTLK